jgi:NAD-dependent DNA ligase
MVGSKRIWNMKDLRKSPSSVWQGHKTATQKSKSELLGLIKGIRADGRVVEEEAAFLKDWIADHHDIRSEWPGNVLFDRIEVMLADRVLDSGEQRELLARLCDFVELRARADSMTISLDQTSATPVTCASPFDDPLPHIEHLGRIFVVTGEFACLKRKDVISEITARGGSVNNAVSKNVHYVLIGSLGSELWSNAGYGTKIERAIELRNAGTPISLISEKHWFDAVGNE